MDGQSPVVGAAPTIPSPAKTPAPDGLPSAEERLVCDLARLLRHAATTKDVEIGKDVLEDAAKALQAGRSLVNEGRPLDGETELQLIKSVDALSLKVAPATIASLEIADIMEVGKSGGDARQIHIRDGVNRLVSRWIWSAICTLILVFIMSAGKEHPNALSAENEGFLASFCGFVDPIILGFLGACAYILRSILQGLANKTFVLRDGTSYMLRSILGMILGFMVPRLYSNQSLGLLNDIAIPFLAGYAVEPMFAALDNLVLTIKDAVSRSSGSGTARSK